MMIINPPSFKLQRLVRNIHKITLSQSIYLHAELNFSSALTYFLLSSVIYLKMKGISCLQSIFPFHCVTAHLDFARHITSGYFRYKNAFSHIEKKSASQQENMKIKNDFFYQKSILSIDFFCFLLKRKSIPQKLFVKYLPVATQTRDTRPSELEQ